MNDSPNYEYRITVTTTDSSSDDRLTRASQEYQPFAGWSYDGNEASDGGGAAGGVGWSGNNDIEAPPRTATTTRSSRRARPSHPWEDFCFPSLMPIPTPPVSPSRNAFGRQPLYENRHSTTGSTHKKAKTTTTSSSSNSVPPVILVPRDEGSIESLGPHFLQIYKVTLPHHLRAAQTFQSIIDACEAYAQTQPNQWETNLYSLTKQDIAVANVPGGPQLVRDIQTYVVETVRQLYHQPAVYMDQNQPHVLKYNCSDDDDNSSNNKSGRNSRSSHCFVPLHHDRCAVTVNLMMSSTSDYTGGGTYLVDLQQNVRLEQGQFLLHPGNLVHSGCPITSGTRYLLVFFCHFQPPPPLR